MVSRVELFLIAAILFFAGRGMLTDVSPSETGTSPQEKELELFSLTFREVNQTALLHTVTADHMVRYPAETVYERFALYTPDLTLLAPRAVQKEARIYLEQNATILKADGSRYQAGGVIYDRHRRQLQLSKAFRFTDRYGDIQGSRMQYDSTEKAIEGEDVKAEYELE